MGSLEERIIEVKQIVEKHIRDLSDSSDTVSNETFKKRQKVVVETLSEATQLVDAYHEVCVDEKTTPESAVRARLEKSFSNENFNILREAKVKLNFEVEVDALWISTIFFYFDKNEKKATIAYDFRYDESADERFLRINASVVGFYGCDLSHLSFKNDNKWKKIAEYIGFPSPLDESARITEFCFSIISPLCNRREFVRYVGRTEIIDRDGSPVYAGHSGLMTVRFAPDFSANTKYVLGECP